MTKQLYLPLHACLHDQLCPLPFLPSLRAVCFVTIPACCAVLCCVLHICRAVEWGQEVALVGGVDTLGAWDVEKSIPMAWNDGDMWTAEAELPTE